jgi:hypothetical protein
VTGIKIFLITVIATVIAIALIRWLFDILISEHVIHTTAFIVRNDCTKLLTQIAAALAIVVALALCVPLEAARHRTKGSKAAFL